MTITLPDHLSERLAQEARARQMPVDALAADLIDQALQPTLDATSDEELQMLVERIKALPASTATIIRATTSLKSALESVTDPDEPFDIDEWNRQWAAIEAEMREAEWADQLRDIALMQHGELSA